MITVAPHKKIDDLARMMRLAGDPARIKILCAIINRRKICVSEIARATKESVAITSHHLKAMAREGLLVTEREGKRICYGFPATPLASDLKRLICKYKDKK